MFCKHVACSSINNPANLVLLMAAVEPASFYLQAAISKTGRFFQILSTRRNHLPCREPQCRTHTLCNMVNGCTQSSQPRERIHRHLHRPQGTSYSCLSDTPCTFAFSFLSIFQIAHQLMQITTRKWQRFSNQASR